MMFFIAMDRLYEGPGTPGPFCRLKFEGFYQYFSSLPIQPTKKAVPNR